MDCRHVWGVEENYGSALIKGLYGGLYGVYSEKFC